MARYAAETTVTVDRSRQEIERILTRYEADERLIYQDDKGRVVIQCRVRGRILRFHIEIPPLEWFQTDETGRFIPPARRRKAQEQEERRRWRVLTILLKAKFETVADATVTDFDREFGPYMVLPNGETAGDWLAPQIEEAYRTGIMPDTLSGIFPASKPLILPPPAAEDT